MTTTVEQQLEMIKGKLESATKGYVTFVHVSEVYDLGVMIAELEKAINKQKEITIPL